VLQRAVDAVPIILRAAPEEAVEPREEAAEEAEEAETEEA